MHHFLISVLVISMAVGLSVWYNKSIDIGHLRILDGYYGGGDYRPDDTLIRRFVIDVDQTQLDDLSNRLNRTRLTESLEASQFHYGTHAKFLDQLLKHWIDKYDWREAEGQLNEYHHYKTQIEGLQIHFVHQRPPDNRYNDTYPILLVHGWPSSFYEFSKVIPMLVDPSKYVPTVDQFAFEVVVPSIPGYGWSEASKKQGLGTLAAARIFAKLMQRLGFEKYFCQGGDWGSVITSTIAQLYPERVLGLHLNMAPFVPYVYPSLWPRMFVDVLLSLKTNSIADQMEVGTMVHRIKFLLAESGYFHIQATKPDTVGAALVDSPIGLAAYMMEKYSTWTRPAYRTLNDGGLDKSFTIDELLTQVMIYWVTKSGATSVRFYKEFVTNSDHFLLLRASVDVPTGIAAYRHDPLIYAKSWLDKKYTNIVRYENIPTGGHFAAFEKPQLFFEDLIKFATICAQRHK